MTIIQQTKGVIEAAEFRQGKYMRKYTRSGIIDGVFVILEQWREVTE